MRRYADGPAMWVKGMVLGTVMVLAGCSTPALQQPKVLNSMVGQSTVDVLRRFGVPARTYDVQGHNFLSYIETETQYSPGYSSWDWGWGSGYGYGGWGGPNVPPSYYSSTCRTTFEVVGDRVVGWKMYGGGC
ncbi:fructose-bisphosphate aldolase [Bombella sp. TMW 2.2559]|uniref:Fructose-bisphosphate aldolase n=1 Tax=Bombella dulcis TaxID=2967339 RepID=A0ABT3WEG0_9PROT|nr:hypothetical protein [Bombella dulcis]MCX5616620.1 fructose-bisphosphate aldolase [Bombella dulcis]